MKDPEKTEVEDKESQAINNGSEGGSNELSQQSVSLDTASGETAETESTALPKEGENEESSECSHDTKSGKKKKKKRKKKKAEMTNVAPDNTEQLLSTLTADVEESNANIDSATKEDKEAARAEEGKVPALEKDGRSSSQMVQDELKPELVTVSHGTKESDSDTDMPAEKNAMESDSADNVSDDPDNEG